MKHLRSVRTAQAGFTIVELMIATMVFSMVLLVITYGVLHFTSDYYKGVNSSSTQVATQNALDAVVQAIQFSGDGTAAGNTATVFSGQTGFFCAGNKIFVYTAGKEYGGTPTVGDWGLYEQSKNGNCSMPSTIPSDGTELLGKNMRVTSVSLSMVDSTTWRINLMVAYGDGDLLCNANKPTGAQGSCDAGDQQYSPAAAVAGDDVRCKSATGSQFCAVSTLSTVAGQRIE